MGEEVYPLNNRVDTSSDVTVPNCSYMSNKVSVVIVQMNGNNSILNQVFIREKIPSSRRLTFI
jgi:hypothetical protein